MLYFPQLSSGATAQYPLVKRRVHRTILNDLGSGRAIKLPDPGAAKIEWEFTFRGLGASERAELETFFHAVEGRLGEFTLLGPTDNLLVWSEDFGAAAWTKGPLISIESGAGGTRLVNTGAASQSVQQTVNGPGWYRYCFSLSVRSDTPTPVTLYREAGGATEEQTWTAGPQWTRPALSGKSQTNAESVTFGIRLAPGAAVEVFGPQAEAQPAPSSYRKTTSRGGVFPRARFDHDALQVVTEGPEQHGCTVRVVAAISS